MEISRGTGVRSNGKGINLMDVPTAKILGAKVLYGMGFELGALANPIIDVTEESPPP